jgi:3-deoxy-alpha-D-manno-octulosonate 8-oxidase
MVNNSKNVPYYAFGEGSTGGLGTLLAERAKSHGGHRIFFVDHFFEGRPLARDLPVEEGDTVFFVSTVDEPTTDGINEYCSAITGKNRVPPSAIVGIGGGCTLDTAKAVSNLLTNGGKAEDYQGWDLVRVPGVYKVGVPTISGTGAESSRTCVLTNRRKNLKLGMNSEHTIFDQLILDPALPVTVPRNQYFYTGMDTYIHCIESLNGSHRHAVGDAFSREALSLSREVFGSADMQNRANAEKLMVASYLGGCAIANSYVGVVHPLSAGLSTVLKIHHGLANCLVMNVMEDFYPKETEEFHRYMKDQGVDLPSGVTANLDDEGFARLYESSIIHEKPLVNALGAEYRAILTRERASEIFRRI